jgi:uncharacterized membrane protein
LLLFEKSKEWIEAAFVVKSRNRMGERGYTLMRMCTSHMKDKDGVWKRMATPEGITLPRFPTFDVVDKYGDFLLSEYQLDVPFHSFPEELNVHGGYRHLDTLVPKWIDAMMTEPSLAQRFRYYIDNQVLIQYFCDSAPESKERGMTNAFIKFLNFPGYGSTPGLIPFYFGGEFSEKSSTMEWVIQNVVNPDIQKLESLEHGLKRYEGKEEFIHFHTLPAADLANMSVMAGHQGAAARGWSVFYCDITLQTGDQDRDKCERRDFQKATELYAEVQKEEERLKGEEGLSEKKREELLGDYIREKCCSQRYAPLLAIFERFTPDAPLHGKCSTVQVLYISLLDFLMSCPSGEEKMKKLVEGMNCWGSKSFATTIVKVYLSKEDEKYRFRLIGNVASKLLKTYMKVVKLIMSEWEISPLLRMKVQAFAFICMRLKKMSEYWEILDWSEYSVNVEDDLEEFQKSGDEILKVFKNFFSESSLTPWLFTLCKDAPHFARELWEKHRVGPAAGSCENGEQRQQEEKRLHRVCAYRPDRWKFSSRQSDLFFVALLRSPSIPSTRLVSEKNHISFSQSGKCVSCGEYDITDSFSCSFCKEVEEKMMYVVLNSILDPIDTAILEQQYIPPIEEAILATDMENEAPKSGEKRKPNPTSIHANKRSRLRFN